MIPDVLAPGLKVVFCGTAMSRKSEANGVYYTGPGNKFWPTLRSIGLIPQDFSPYDYRRMPEHGIGLTNLTDAFSGMDHEIPRGAFDAEALKAKILRFKPRCLAFNGKRAAQEALGKKPEYGLQDIRIGNTDIFVLPSTSGAANGFWDEARWRELAMFLG
jgi:TDG/mug DNA glycosylase family protein